MEIKSWPEDICWRCIETGMTILFTVLIAFASYWPSGYINPVLNLITGWK